MDSLFIFKNLSSKETSIFVKVLFSVQLIEEKLKGNISFYFFFTEITIYNCVVLSKDKHGHITVK